MTWRIAVDTGGTFTDCVAIDPGGQVHRAKVLSSGVIRGRAAAVQSPRAIAVDDSFRHPPEALPGARLRPVGPPSKSVAIRAFDVDTRVLSFTDDLSPEEERRLESDGLFEIDTGEPAPVLAARLVTGTPKGTPLPPTVFRLATTRATNALLERAYAPTALLVTHGFRDLLRIGDQRRPDLFALDIVKPAPLTELVYEVSERIDAQGVVLAPLDEQSVRDAARQAREAGARVAAVAFVNSWMDPSHEQRATSILREEGFDVVVPSAQLVPRVKYLERAQTSVIEAALTPVLGQYLLDIRRRLDGQPVQVLTSAGAIQDAESFHPVDGLLSGPAGGVVGAAAAGRGVSPKLISFDMGGTSTDVARRRTHDSFVHEHDVGGARVARRALAIETVAAGGGSICSVVEGRPRVGPESAGASPGPACYGAGGPLTITDVNLLLGRIDPEGFEIPVDGAASRRAAESLALDVRRQTGSEVPDLDALLAGFLELANERMAAAIRRISVRKGYDPAEHALVAFGGAGPQHACHVAQELGSSVVLIPEDASILSAIGLGAARQEVTFEHQCLCSLKARATEIEAILSSLEARAGAKLRQASSGDRPIELGRVFSLRLAGQEHSLDIGGRDVPSLAQEFETHYREVFGYLPEGRDVELESIRVTASIASDWHFEGQGTIESGQTKSSERAVFLDGEWRTAPVHSWHSALNALDPIAGPCIVRGRRTEVVVPGGWVARRTDGDSDTGAGLLLEHSGASGAEPADDESRVSEAAAALIAREITIHRLSTVAEEMGDALGRAAVSPNVKERRDYSCGVLDADGFLVASAPHLPVHLGALGHCARRVVETLGPLEEGDAVVTNHPAFGGSHLPDVTLIQPVFDSQGGRLAHVASRAHHAEIGGASPGSMPASATRLVEEGVVIEPTYLYRRGEPRWGAIERLLRDAPFPTRSLEDNLADLRAAVAAGRRGARAILDIDQGAADSSSTRDAMRWIVQHSASLVRDALAVLPGTRYEASDRLDDGSPLAVRIALDGERAIIDFTGTAPEHPRNLNAPLVVTRSAVAYVMRLLIDRPVPLNDGLLEPIEVVVPEGCLLNPVFAANPEQCPAVAGGNVETSQRVVDLLIRALGLTAGGQASMNNLLIGNDRFGSYETICGGAGATSNARGADAVHTHMTNTAITDVEVLERRYPMRVERFEIRRGSGGAGRHRGGDGVVRELVMLDEVEATILAQRRAEGAFGLLGGRAGHPGRQVVLRADGSREPWDGKSSVQLGPGDRVRIETPGGGGWGTPSEEP